LRENIGLHLRTPLNRSLISVDSIYSSLEATLELDIIRHRIEDDQFARFMGIRLLDLRAGYSKMSMTVADSMVNLHNVAHGGAIFSLADAAFAAAANSRGQKGVALSMAISYCAPAKEGDKLIAEAFEESLGTRIGFYRIVVRTEEGKLIASSQGTEYVKPAESV
jgi:acyl-CoA thioesterase